MDFLCEVNEIRLKVLKILRHKVKYPDTLRVRAYITKFECLIMRTRNSP